MQFMLHQKVKFVLLVNFVNNRNNECAVCRLYSSLMRAVSAIYNKYDNVGHRTTELIINTCAFHTENI